MRIFTEALVDTGQWWEEGKREKSLCSAPVQKKKKGEA